MKPVSEPFFVRASIPLNNGESIKPNSGWFIVSSHLQSSSDGAAEMARGDWYKITRKREKGRPVSIYRVLRFSPNLKRDHIVLDWDAQLALEVKDSEPEQPIRLTIEKMRGYEFPQAVLSDPDPLRRISGGLGLLSVFLGLLSIVLSLM